MLNHRNTPLPFTPHPYTERKVEGLRDVSPIPATYRKYQLMPDGKIVFVGEFPTPRT